MFEHIESLAFKEFDDGVFWQIKKNLEIFYEHWTLSWWSFGSANTFKCLESLVDKTNNTQSNTGLKIFILYSL